MKKHLIVVLIIAGITFNKIYTSTSDTITSNNFNYYTYINNIEKPRDKEKIDKFWSAENESFLSLSEKEILNKLRIKVEAGNNLTTEEREILSRLRGETIKKKLGDVRFERYKKLIEKREKQENGKLEIELTKEEKAEIYNFEKEIRGK